MKTAKPNAGNAGAGFSAEERAAMKARVKEMKAGQRGSEGAATVLAAIAAMPQPDRGLAERLHTLITGAAPELTPKTWYGMPAYARGDSVICYFQGAYKFKARYATLGFSDKAKLDEGAAWPNSYAIKELNREVEALIRGLLRRALA